jgi:hypothetical protein
MSSQAGMLAVFGFAKSIELGNLLQEITSTDTSRTRCSLASAISMVAGGFIGGAKSVLKVSSLWNDQLLAEIAGLEAIPDDSNIGRIFKRQSNQTIPDFEALPQKIEDKVLERFLTTTTMRKACAIEELIDIDGTPSESYGYQEGAVKGLNHKKRGGRCYQALLAFDAITKTVKLAWLQSGNTHCANGIVDFIRQLHSHNPKQKKLYRKDSGFFSNDALNEIEGQGNGYLVKAKLTNSIRSRFNELDWKVVPGKPGRRGWEEVRFCHACSGWTRERNFVAVRIKVAELKEEDTLFPDHVIDKYAYFCYVTTRDMSPWATHKFYGQRASCENLIEELKNQIGLGKMKSNDFKATTLYFHCAILAYNLMRWMAACSGRSRLVKWEISSLRCFLVRIAGCLVRGARKLKVKINQNHFYQDEVDAWMSFCSVF